MARLHEAEARVDAKLAALSAQLGRNQTIWVWGAIAILIAIVGYPGEQTPADNPQHALAWDAISTKLKLAKWTKNHHYHNHKHVVCFAISTSLKAK